MLDYIELPANQAIDNLLPSLLIGHTYYIKDSISNKYNEYVLVPKKKEYAGLVYDKDKVEDILIKELKKKSKQVKLTFTANADTTVKVYFTKESYDSKTSDDTISLTANEEKTTIYNRDSIYFFDTILKIKRHTSNGIKTTKYQYITSCKIEGIIINGKLLFQQIETSPLKNIDVSKLDTSQMTDMNGMFSNCSQLTSLDLSNFDTSKVTDMGFMFKGCSRLTALDVSKFNTSNVTNMRSIFERCSSLTSLDLSNFNTSNVTDMTFMFLLCPELTTLDVSNWNTSKVTGMFGMFEQCHKLTTIGQVDKAPGWQHKPNSYEDMFYNCPATPKPSWYAA